MKKFSFILLTVAFVVAAFAAFQQPTVSFDERWKKVEELAEKQLPESALKEVDAILKEAKKQNNSIEVIKATLYKMRFTLEKDPDRAPQLIKEFENSADNASDIAEKSLLYSMTAELYAQYYLSQSFRINQRTEIVGYVPENMNEWSKNIFFDKICSLLNASLQNEDILKNTSSSKFEPLLLKGEDSQLFAPTLFDLLCRRKIDILSSIKKAAVIENPLNDDQYFSDATIFVTLKLDPEYEKSVENQILKTYQRLIHFHLTQKNTEALIYNDLNRLRYLYQQTNKEEKYLQALENLEKNYEQNPLVIEVLAEKATYYLQKSTESDENKFYRRLAYQVCEKGISFFPDYKRINLLKNIQREITQKNLSIAYPATVKPNANVALKISSSNISSLTIHLYRVNASAMEYVTFQKNKKNRDEMYPEKVLLEKYECHLKPDSNFSTVDTIFTFQTKNYGIYEIKVAENENLSESEAALGAFVVSDFTCLTRSNRPDNQSVYTLDRCTGKRISDVQVKTYDFKWNGKEYQSQLLHQTETDKNGFCFIPTKSTYFQTNLFFEKGEDCYFSTVSFVQFYEPQRTATEKVQVSLFTDRSIYRPGQTVYFKGIAYFLNAKRQEVDKFSKYEVSLFDANHQKINSKTFTTNEFGSFTGAFILPENGLNGTFTLECSEFSASFQVEEYKRPTFEIKLEKPLSEISFGENVLLKGNAVAYAGYPVVQANVTYRIVRRNHYLWWYPEVKEVANGKTTTDENGNFEINFIPIKDQKKKEQYYTYTIYVSITDTKGETQQAQQTISVGDKSLFILAEVPKKWDKAEKMCINVSLETLNGNKIDGKLNYAIYQLPASVDFEEEDADIKTNSDRALTKIADGIFETSNKQLGFDFRHYKSGRYRIIFTAFDTKGKEIKLEKDFVLYSLTDKRPPVKTYTWLVSPKTEVAPNENAKIYFGTSTTDTEILYELMRGNKTLESKWIKFNNEIKTFEIPFATIKEGGVTVMFTFVKNEKIFRKQISLKQKKSENKLTPFFSVFRDKLSPNETAEWTVTIPELKNSGKTAELLTTMYDASLDAIYPHNWYFYPVYQETFVPSPIWQCRVEEQERDFVSVKTDFLPVKNFELDQINWFGLSLLSNVPYLRPMRMGSLPVQKQKVLLNQSDQIAGAKPFGIINEELETTDLAKEPVQIRSEFNETAFFYPQLHTDSLGNVKFSFTVPESLTRWNIKMLAHTPDLYFGQADTQVVVQKELMVQMNLPRFVHRGDTLMLTANVVNLTHENQTVKVTFEMLQPETEQNISLPDVASKTIVLTPQQTRVVEWKVSQFTGFDLVICKVVAQSENFSDGEQKYLPILPDRILMTESLPVTVRGGQTRTFTFDNFIRNYSKTETKRLSFEFSDQPIWYAVQALPALSSPENENAIDYLSAYYVNSLAGFIVSSYPKIAAIFDQWKTSPANKEALLSNLEKNKELKNLLLEETPWVLEAKDETEQKKRIALLFDVNMQKNNVQQYLDKLLQFQNADGSFSWFKGMPKNRYITQEILLNLGKLRRLTNSKFDEKLQSSVHSAINYLDLQIAHDFFELKKTNKNYLNENCIQPLQLFYLYVRSEFPEISLSDTITEAINYFSSQAEKYWKNQTLFGKATTAIIAHRNGKDQLANNILNSLEENALKSETEGMYWAQNKAGYFWNERPIAVQTAIIEAFSEIRANDPAIEEMKIWLLKQKQTQRWDSPISTINAIYALLSGKEFDLTTDGKVKIQIGNETLHPEAAEAGTQYFKITFPAEKITPSMGNITIEKSSKGIGWGAMYWQHDQDFTTIENQENPLKVEKKLFVEKFTPQGKTMIPVEQTELKKGDKIITRLVVIANRYFEFVAIKDIRAACLEPLQPISGCRWKEGICYYQTNKDASTQFFFNFLPKGTYVLEYESWINNSGTFSNGIASIQCMYAPEFVSYTGGGKIYVIQ